MHLRQIGLQSVEPLDNWTVLLHNLPIILWYTKDKDDNKAIPIVVTGLQPKDGSMSA